MSNAIIDIDKLKSLFIMVKPTDYVGYEIRNSLIGQTWQKLFDFYNANHPPEKYPLWLGCRSCYWKVYEFVKKYIESNA